MWCRAKCQARQLLQYLQLENLQLEYLYILYTVIKLTTYIHTCSNYFALPLEFLSTYKYVRMMYDV
jgi:hypothetical protein